MDPLTLDNKRTKKKLPKNLEGLVAKAKQLADKLGLWKGQIKFDERTCLLAVQERAKSSPLLKDHGEPGELKKVAKYLLSVMTEAVELGYKVEDKSIMGVLLEIAETLFINKHSRLPLLKLQYVGGDKLSEELDKRVVQVCETAEEIGRPESHTVNLLELCKTCLEKKKGKSVFIKKLSNKEHHQEISDTLFDVMSEAATCDYDIEAEPVQVILFGIADMVCIENHTLSCLDLDMKELKGFKSFKDIKEGDEKKNLKTLILKVKDEAEICGKLDKNKNVAVTLKDCKEYVGKQATGTVLLQRDEKAKEAVAKNFHFVLEEALKLRYDIGVESVKSLLFAIAVLMHTDNYTPMRVLGSTVEAIVPKNNNNDQKN